MHCNKSDVRLCKSIPYTDKKTVFINEICGTEMSTSNNVWFGIFKWILFEINVVGHQRYLFGVVFKQHAIAPYISSWFKNVYMTLLGKP